MADNYLITGYWGKPHVTAENDRGINAGIFGAGRFVLNVGERFRAEYIGNNTIRVHDGKLMDNGAAAGIPAGEYIDLQIANARQGMQRNDLIVFQYELDPSTLIETGTFVVIQGTETSAGSSIVPGVTQEDLLSGEARFDQMALWRVPVSEATISDPVQMFEVYEPAQAKKLLWENSDTVSLFTEQNISIPNLSDYSGIEIVFMADHADQVIKSTGFLPYAESKNFTLDCISTAMLAGTPTLEKRIGYFTPYALHFCEGKYCAIGGNAMETNNLSCIPYRVYGIKGVQNG